MVVLQVEDGYPTGGRWLSYRWKMVVLQVEAGSLQIGDRIRLVIRGSELVIPNHWQMVGLHDLWR